MLSSAPTALHYSAGATPSRKCLVIGADALSRWVDWDDRNTCILFGDGAGAMVLEAAEGDDGAGLLGELPDLGLACLGCVHGVAVVCAM